PDPGQGRAGHGDGPRQGAGRARYQHVRAQRDEAAGDVGGRDDRAARQGAPRVGLLESELEAQHEVAPRVRSPLQGRDDRRALLGRDAVVLQELFHFAGFDLRLLLDLELFTLPLARVVLDVALARALAAAPPPDPAA